MPIRETAPLLMPRSLVGPLMQLYDYPHPRKPGRVIRGYDRHMRCAPPACAQRSRGAWVTLKCGWSGTRLRAVA